MNDNITFAELDQVLSKLGFCKTVVTQNDRVPNKVVVYRYSDDPKAILLAPFHKPSDVVAWRTLYGIRHDLEVYQIATADAFEDMLNSTAA